MAFGKGASHMVHTVVMLKKQALLQAYCVHTPSDLNIGYTVRMVWANCASTEELRWHQTREGWGSLVAATLNGMLPAG